MEYLDYIDDFLQHTTHPASECFAKFKIKDIFLDHWDNFVADTPDINIRPVVHKEVNKMMNCGSFSNGYSVYSCDNCNNYLYVPFTCKSHFCPSCGIKYTLDRSDSISVKCIKCPHRHLTFTIHKDLRILFWQDRNLLNLLFEAVKKTILSWFYDINHKENFTPRFYLYSSYFW